MHRKLVIAFVILSVGVAGLWWHSGGSFDSMTLSVSRHRELYIISTYSVLSVGTRYTTLSPQVEHGLWIGSSDPDAYELAAQRVRLAGMDMPSLWEQKPFDLNHVDIVRDGHIVYSARSASVPHWLVVLLLAVWPSVLGVRSLYRRRPWAAAGSSGRREARL